MKQIACIHTLYSVIEPFTQQLKEGISEKCLIHTLYDDFLATDPSPGRSGWFTPINYQRLRQDLQSQAMTGADIIVVTCSTLSPAVRGLRKEFNVPIVTIDEAMMKKAVEIGSKIGIVATAKSTIAPSVASLRTAAKEVGKELDIRFLNNEEAYVARTEGNVELHDRLVLEAADQMRDREVILLAQASMAHLEQAVAARSGILTLSSPRLCIASINQILRG